jgi:hypothetical protein
METSLNDILIGDFSKFIFVATSVVSLFDRHTIIIELLDTFEGFSHNYFIKVSKHPLSQEYNIIRL